MLRLRTRNQHRRRHKKVQPPELLMSRDVLSRHSGRAARKNVIVASRFVGTEFPLRMRIEISPVATEREHDEEFRVHARRRNERRSQLLNRRVQGLAKLHESFHHGDTETGKDKKVEETTSHGPATAPRTTNDK